MTKSLCALFACVAMAGLLSACGGAEPAKNTAAPTNAAAPKPAAPPTNTATGPSTAAESDLKITNKSEWAVHHLYLSPANENQWGPDQLGTTAIEPGKEFTLKKIPCDTYDLKIVDEDGDECVIKGEKFCGNEVTWNLTDEELLACAGYGDDE